MNLNNRTGVLEKKNEKECQFPECKEIYFGTGHSKYCEEHRKSEYRKVIDLEKNKEEKEQRKLNDSNQTIKHSFATSKLIKVLCQTCGKEFEVLVRPNVYVYPKYCELHRNEWKRVMYEKNIGT